MATTTSGSITFEQDGAHCELHCPSAISLAALRTFARALATYTNAKIESISFSTRETIDDLPGSADPIQGLDFMALLHLRGATSANDKLAIPSPKATMFDTDNQKFNVSKSAGDELAALCSALTGEALTFSHGRLT